MPFREEEGKKKSEAAPKRPRAKRKAKKASCFLWSNVPRRLDRDDFFTPEAEDAIVIDDAEPCLSPDTNGVTNGEQHSEDCAMCFCCSDCSEPCTLPIGLRRIVALQLCMDFCGRYADVCRIRGCV